MSWFKDIFQRGKAQERTSSIALSDLEAWLEERGVDPKAERRLSDIYKRVGQVANDLSEDGKALESALPDDATHLRLLKAGQGARGEIIKQIDSLTPLLSAPQRADIESAEAYHSSLVKALGRTVTKFRNAQRYATALFPNEAGKINSDLNRLNHILIEMEDEISKKRDETDGIRTARNLLTKIKSERIEVQNLDRGIKNNETGLAELIDIGYRLEEELRAIASSEEGRRTEDLQRAIDQKRGELRLIEGQMSNLVSPLNKALARIVKQEKSSRLSLHHREVFERLSSSPERANDEDISSALYELRSNVDSLGLKDKKREKILESIDRLIGDKSLEALKARYTDVFLQISKIESRLEKACLRSIELKKELDGVRSRIALLEANLEADRINLRSLKNRESLDEAELKREMERLSDGPVEIDFEQRMGEGWVKVR